jgi:hypothetical protein
LRNLDEVNRRQHHSTTLGSTDGVVSIAYARSGPGFLDRLRRARDQSCPGVSLTALITSQFLRYLSAENVHIEDVVSFIVDLSRHLPSGVGTLGNFVGTAPVHVAPPYSAETVTASLDEYTRGGRSLVRFGLGYAATLINGPPANVLYKGDNSLARVVISDHANTTAAHKIAWAESPDGHIFVRKAPVGYTNQITLAINRVESELHLTASHYGSVMDASTLQRVLDKMTNNDNLSRTR